MSYVEFNLNFNNTDYILYLSSVDDIMKIDLETVHESLYWKAEFEAKYIEEITNKSGSYKSFHVFLKMFMSALSKESDSVLIDLISYKDIEQMKMKKLHQNSNIARGSPLNDSVLSSSMNDSSKVNKKYFIMSYTNEFEKVHYPLPIQFMTVPDTKMLLRTIERIKKLNSVKNTNTLPINMKEIEEIKNENINLKNKIKLLESQRKFGAVENEEFIRNYSVIKDEFENFKIQSENKVKLLIKTIDDLRLKISSSTGSTQNISTMNGNESYIKELQNKLEQASEIVNHERRLGKSYVDEKIKEIEKLQKEIVFLKENEKKFKVKINQLERDLDLSNKRNIYELNVGMNLKNKNYSSTPKSNFSYKSNSVKSVNSNVSSVTKKSNTSNIKKNLQPNPYNKYKALNTKNYSPLKFFDKKTERSNKSVKSNTSLGKSVKSNLSNKTGSGSKINSIYSKNTSTNKVLSNKNSKKLIKPNTIKNLDKSSSNSIKIHYNVAKANTTYTNDSTCNLNNLSHNNNHEVNNLIEEKTKIVNRMKLENETFNKILNPIDINERLGRIQNLLDSAKV